MVTAIVLLNVHAEETDRVAAELVEIKGVSEVFSVAGNYDLVALVRVPDNETLANLVTGRIRKIGAITSTETLIGFRAYSRAENWRTCRIAGSPSIPRATDFASMACMQKCGFRKSSRAGCRALSVRCAAGPIVSR